MGCTGKWFWHKLQMQADSKLNSREITPYRTEMANTFCKGLVAGNCKLQREKPGTETIERGASYGTITAER